MKISRTVSVATRGNQNMHIIVQPVIRVFLGEGFPLDEHLMLSDSSSRRVCAGTTITVLGLAFALEGIRTSGFTRSLSRLPCISGRVCWRFSARKLASKSTRSDVSSPLKPVDKTCKLSFPTETTFDVCTQEVQTHTRNKIRSAGCDTVSNSRRGRKRITFCCAHHARTVALGVDCGAHGACPHVSIIVGGIVAADAARASTHVRWGRLIMWTTGAERASQGT
jgi:hypothetical protein